MSVLLAAATLAATASVVATGCVAYILISFRRSGNLFASRIGRQRLTVVLLTTKGPSRKPWLRTQAIAPCLQPMTTS